MGVNNRMRKVDAANAVHNLKETKDSFFVLCTQYAQLGKYLNLHAKAVATSIMTGGEAAQTLQVMIAQHQEMGEQMKNLGRGLDSLGGKPVLEAPESPEGNGEQKGN